MYVCHGTLRDIAMHLIAPDAQFAGASAVIGINIQSTRRSVRYGIGLAVLGSDHWVWTDVPAQGTATVHMAFKPERRGLHRVPALAYLVLEKTAREVAKLIIPSQDGAETRKTINYVLTELLRNVVQHSRDDQGGIVGAQLMRKGGAGYRESAVQVVVVGTALSAFGKSGADKSCWFVSTAPISISCGMPDCCCGASKAAGAIKKAASSGCCARVFKYVSSTEPLGGGASVSIDIMDRQTRCSIASASSSFTA